MQGVPIRRGGSGFPESGSTELGAVIRGAPRRIGAHLKTFCSHLVSYPEIRGILPEVSPLLF
jgi:hypothetical protein